LEVLVCTPQFGMLICPPLAVGETVVLFPTGVLISTLQPVSNRITVKQNSLLRTVFPSHSL
jgi:hypothetical protein